MAVTDKLNDASDDASPSRKKPDEKAPSPTGAKRPPVSFRNRHGWPHRKGVVPAVWGLVDHAGTGGVGSGIQWVGGSFSLEQHPQPCDGRIKTSHVPGPYDVPSFLVWLSHCPSMAEPSIQRITCVPSFGAVSIGCHVMRQSPLAWGPGWRRQHRAPWQSSLCKTRRHAWRPTQLSPQWQGCGHILSMPHSRSLRFPLEVEYIARQPTPGHLLASVKPRRRKLAASDILLDHAVPYTERTTNARASDLLHNVRCCFHRAKIARKFFAVKGVDLRKFLAHIHHKGSNA